MALAAGKVFSSACPLGLIRSAGIRLPGNGMPVNGSVTTIRLPPESKLCEKSPIRSNAVGTVACDALTGASTLHFSKL